MKTLPKPASPVSLFVAVSRQPHVPARFPAAAQHPSCSATGHTGSAPRHLLNWGWEREEERKPGETKRWWGKGTDLVQTTDERADKENMEELIQNNKKQRESNEQSQNKNGRLEKQMKT